MTTKGILHAVFEVNRFKLFIKCDKINLREMNIGD